MEDLEVTVKELEPDLLWMMYGSPRGLDVWSDIAFKEDLRSLEPEELAGNPVFWREFVRAASVLEVTLVVRTCHDMTASQLPTRLVGGLLRAIEKQKDTPEIREAAGDLGMFIKDLQGEIDSGSFVCLFRHIEVMLTGSEMSLAQTALLWMIALGLVAWFDGCPILSSGLYDAFHGCK